MARATLTAMMAASGPSSTATSRPPTAWAVVPSGMGTLSIITRKQKAAPMAIRGTSRRLTFFLTRRAETVQTGTMAAAPTAQVCGLR